MVETGEARRVHDFCLLAGYGAYGTVIDPVFSPVSVSLLDRGLQSTVAPSLGAAVYF